MFWVALGIVLVAIVVALSVRPVRRIYREVELERARKLFVQQREHLEAKFFQLAANSGKPKGLRWERCDFHSPFCFARDRNTGQLSAFVEVTIGFSAIEGGGMEHVAAVSNLRHASAVFHFYRGRWGTAGRALFNMTPAEAVAHLSQQLDAIPSAGLARNSLESE